jgi:hypothetical protein
MTCGNWQPHLLVAALNGYSDSTMTTPQKMNPKSTARVPSTAFMLVDGPKNMPLMLEQSGVR